MTNSRFDKILLWNIGFRKGTKCQQSDVCQYSVLMVYTWGQLNSFTAEHVFRCSIQEGAAIFAGLKDINSLIQNGHYWSVIISIWEQAGNHNMVQQSPCRSTFKHQFTLLIIHSFRTGCSGIQWAFWSFFRTSVWLCFKTNFTEYGSPFKWGKKTTVSKYYSELVKVIDLYLTKEKRQVSQKDSRILYPSLTILMKEHF